MNICIIDADSILWTADKNIRLVDFGLIIKNACAACKPEQIYLIGGFDKYDPFRDEIQAIAEKAESEGLPLLRVSSKYSLGGNHNSEAMTVDLLYRGAISQEEPCSNSFVIATASAGTINAAMFLEDKGIIRDTSFILADTVSDYDNIAERFRIPSIIPLRPDSRTVLDKLVIGEILKLVKSDGEHNYTNTLRSLISKCENYSNIPPSSTKLIVSALLRHHCLEKTVFANKEGMKKTGLILGSNAEKMLDSLKNPRKVPVQKPSDKPEESAVPDTQNT